MDWSKWFFHGKVCTPGAGVAGAKMDRLPARLSQPCEQETTATPGRFERASGNLGRIMGAGLVLAWAVQVEPAPCDLLFGYAWLRRLGAGRFRWYRTSITGALVAFLALNVLQLSWATEIGIGLRFLFITMYVVSLCFLFASVVQSGADFAAVRRFYLVGVMVAAVTLLVLTTLQLWGASGHLAQLYYAKRPKGFFKDPNVAGPFAVTGALAAFSRLIFVRQKVTARQSVMLVTTAGAAVVTFSRGALVNLVAGVAILGFIALLRGRNARFVIVAVIVAVLSVALVPKALEAFGQTERFRGLTAYDLLGRLGAWKSSPWIFKDAPWGTGPGQFEVVSPKYQERLGVILITPSAHNTYLRVWVENGLIGLALLLASFLSIFWTSFKLAIVAKEREAVADAAWLCAAWGGMLVESCVIDTIHWRHLWIIAGLILAQQKLCRAERSHQQVAELGGNGVAGG